MDPQKRQRSRPTTAPQRRPTHTKLTKKHSSWTMKDWFSNAPKQGYYHTKIFTSHTKTYLAICKNAVREANVIESNGSQRVLDISIQTMGGRTYTVIMYSSGHRNLVNRGRITFKTDRVRKLHDFEKVAGKVADKTYELKTRGKDVICTNYDMFEPESLKAGRLCGRWGCCCHDRRSWDCGAGVDWIGNR